MLIVNLLFSLLSDCSKTFSWWCVPSQRVHIDASYILAHYNSSHCSWFWAYVFVGETFGFPNISIWFFLISGIFHPRQDEEEKFRYLKVQIPGWWGTGVYRRHGKRNWYTRGELGDTVWSTNISNFICSQVFSEQSDIYVLVSIWTCRFAVSVFIKCFFTASFPTH